MSRRLLTPEHLAALLRAIETGQSLAGAARRMGVSVRTVEREAARNPTWREQLRSARRRRRLATCPSRTAYRAGCRCPACRSAASAHRNLMRAGVRTPGVGPVNCRIPG